LFIHWLSLWAAYKVFYLENGTILTSIDMEFQEKVFPFKVHEQFITHRDSHSQSFIPLPQSDTSEASTTNTLLPPTFSETSTLILSPSNLLLLLDDLLVHTNNHHILKTTSVTRFILVLIALYLASMNSLLQVRNIQSQTMFHMINTFH